MTSLNPVYTVGWQIAEAVRAHQDVSKDEAAAKAVELLEMVGHPQRHRAGRQLPARVLRRHAPAGGHRHGHGQRPRGHPGRRAHHGARRDRAGPGARLAQDGPGRRPGRRCCSSPTTWASSPASPTVSWSCTPGAPVEIGTAWTSSSTSPAMPYTHGLLGSLPRLDARAASACARSPGRHRRSSATAAAARSPPAARSRRDICDLEEPELRPVVLPTPRGRSGRRGGRRRRRGRRRPRGGLPLRRRGGRHADGVDVPGLVRRPRRGGAVTSVTAGTPDTPTTPQAGDGGDRAGAPARGHRPGQALPHAERLLRRASR